MSNKKQKSASDKTMAQIHLSVFKKQLDQLKGSTDGNYKPKYGRQMKQLKKKIQKLEK